MSEETISSVLYSNEGRCAAFIASFTSSSVTVLFNVAYTSVIEPVIVGTRTAVPSILPLISGITSPTAIAAPVDAGIALAAPARFLRPPGASCNA